MEFIYFLIASAATGCGVQLVGMDGLAQSTTTAQSLPPSPSPSPSQIFNTFNYFCDGSAVVAGYSVDSLSGEITELISSMPATQCQYGMTNYTLASLDQVVTYADPSQVIHAFKVDRSTGELNEVPGSPLSPALDFGSSRNIDSSGRFMVIADDATDETIYSFTLDSITGGLTQVDSLLVGNGNGAAVYDSVVSANGKFFYGMDFGAANGGHSTTIYAFSIDQTTGMLTARGSYAYACSPTTSGQVYVDATNTYLFAECVDANVPKIFSWKIDPTLGTLTPAGTASVTVPGDTTISKMVVDNTGSFLYVQAGNAGGTYAYSIHADGSLSILNGATMYPGTVTTISPNNKFVSSFDGGGGILISAIGPTGLLVPGPSGASSCPSSSNNSLFQIFDPTSQFLYSPNNAAIGNICSFKIDDALGTLSLANPAAVSSGQYAVSAVSILVPAP